MFLRHEPCPKCGPVQDRAGDNLGVYSDGHKWCFACGYYVASSGITNIQDIRTRINKEIQEKKNLPLHLPYDLTHILPLRAANWLLGYGITSEEINKYKIGWSPAYNRLVFPCFDDVGNVLMWQGRYFPELGKDDVNRSKYFTNGKPESILALFGHEESEIETVCCVEDFISAIKVARIMPSMCLWGSELSISRLRRLSMLFSNIIIWLDADKASYSARCEIKARPYFSKVTGLYTSQDPKFYTIEEIRKWILS